MKKFKLFLLLAAVCGALTSAGCSDDDVNGIDTQLLTGKWECYKAYLEYFDKWHTDFGEGSELLVFEFRGDGTGACLDGRWYTDPWEEITYSVDGNELTIVYVQSGLWESLRVDELNSSEMVWAYDDEDEGERYTDKVYFKRVA